MKKAKVLFEYSAIEGDELSLQVGDIITEVEPADTGWCKGFLNGKRGMFPDNFVEMIENEEKAAPTPPPAQKKPSKKTSKRRVRAAFTYTAENEDELSLEVGDIVEVLKDVEEGWAEGTCKGRRGVYPTNFVEALPESSESEESGDGTLEKKPEPHKEESPQNDEPLATSSQKKVKGVGLGNIFADGPIKLRQRSIGESDKKKNFSTPSAKPTKEKEATKDLHSSSIVKPKKNVYYCRAMFEYNRENDDELDLRKGEIITVTDKEGGDEGWWEGEKINEDGKKLKGVFPDNFVVLLTPEETKEHERQLQAKNEPESSRDSKFVKSPSPKDLKPTSFKKTAPMVPAPPSQGAKPIAAMTVNNEVDHADSADTTFPETTATTEHTLAHVKRPAGPKNRRKPGATERREKAQSSLIPEQNGEMIESEEEKPNKTETELVTPKKEPAKRGVAVLPGPSEGGTGETPPWLQNLKSQKRQSQKRPSPVATPPSSGKEPSPSETTTKPSWLQNLKKRQSSEFPPNAAARSEPTPKPAEKVALQPPKPAEKATAPPPAKPAEHAVPKPANGHVPLPTKPIGSIKAPQKPAPPTATEKPLAAWQIERQQKTKKNKPADASVDEPAPEPPVTTAASGEPAATPAWKNSLPRKSPTVTKPVELAHPPKKVGDKPPFGAPLAPAGSVRPKPAPPKGKPAPAAKPASLSAVEELKDELKHMKEEMEKIRDEMKKEILKLNQELLDERKQRMTLQAEVAKLRQQLAS